MKKIIFSMMAFAGIMANAQSIGGTLSSENSKWTYGGGVGVGFSSGNNYSGTSVSISPRVGYKINEDFEAGILGGFSWHKNTFFTHNMLSIGPFANYYFGRNFYVSGQYQHYFVNQKHRETKAKFNKEEDALYLGGGYMTQIGNGAYMQFGAYYNVLYKEKSSIFGTGFVPSVGFVFGL